MSIGGLTPAGFVAPTVEELITDINTQLLAGVDAGLDLSPDQPLGQIVGIFAEKLTEVWEANATAYNALNPDAAEGQLLDNVSAISGTRRHSATYSKVTGTLNLNASTTVAAGSIVSVLGQPSNRWVLLANVTNSGGSPANVSGSFRSEQLGPFAANAGTLTVIETPISGWNSVTNAADEVEGIPEDTDAVLRLRRVNELSASGSGTVDAIRADVLEVVGVIQCSVFENTTMGYVNSIPPKSFQVVIWDGPSPAANSVAVAQAIWNAKPSGISSFSITNTFYNAIDSRGAARPVFFDRATQKPVFMSLQVTRSKVIAGQEQGIKDALAAYGLEAFNLGIDVVALAFRAQALTIPGILDVPTFTLDFSSSPVGTSNLAIGELEIATLSSTNIVVTFV